MKQNKININKEIAEAIYLHQKGNLEEAKKRYKKILKINEENSDANHILGVIYFQQKK